MVMESEIRAKFAAANQEHVFAHWDSLSKTEQNDLLSELSLIDLSDLSRLYKQSQEESAQFNFEKLGPCPSSWFASSIPSKSSNADREKWLRSGLSAVENGKIGMILLAGGQGTRLGFNLPKGMFDVELPSRKSLFQLHAERILKMQSKSNNPIPWYIMTSQFTHSDTVNFFREKNFFGLDEKNVLFFMQGSLPAFTKDGKIIMASKGHVQVAPNGNGGIFPALEKEGIMDDMKRRGLLGAIIYSVDNVQIRMADPLFAGFCIESNSDCAAKMVAKAYPGERVGMFAELDGKLHTVEYSELPADKAHSPNFGHGNIAVHYFSVPFMERAISLMKGSDVRYHVAVKQIDSVDGKVEGIKLEAFIFDVFPYANTPRLFEVSRAEEFAPVKNKRGADNDTPDTAKRLVLNLHKKWCATDIDVEVSPLVSAYGEGIVDNPQEQKLIALALDEALKNGASVPLHIVAKQNGKYLVQ
eukprot:ANDGO_02115.mRNA.1 UDP-N-acetylglucosamine diphosphorylase 2